MKKKIVGIFVMTLLIATVLSLTTTNVIAEEPEGEPPGYGEWYIYGNGTYFELTNSIYYNVTLTSSENISVHLESTPGFVIFYIENNSLANSTIISLTGFEVNKSYYLYQDFIQEWQFTTDGNGSYCYTQDLEMPHDIVILENPSTIYIRSDGSIDPPTAPIINIGNTYLLTDNLYTSIYYGQIDIVIQKSNIIFDGQGHTIRFFGSYAGGYGIWIANVVNVTIRNLNFIHKSRGVHVRTVPHLTITDCTFSQTYYPMEISRSNYATITNNIVIDNTNLGVGIWLNYGCHYSIVGNNTISSNGYGDGIQLINSYFTTVTNNTISNCNRGIYIWQGKRTIINNNVISNNNCGFGFSGIAENTFYHNNITSNTQQVIGTYASSNNWDNGAGEGNYWSDYNGVDDGSGGRPTGDGIGDTLIPHPYTDQGNGYYQLDNYPLMLPWSSNEPPIADAGGPYEVYEGEEIIFDASLSADPDNDPLEYRWDFNNDGIWDTTYSTDHTATNTWYGDYTGEVMVEVYDGEFTDTTIATVSVLDLAPTAGFTWSPEPQDEGSPIQFTDASTSYPDDIVGWSWDFAGLGTSTDQNPSFTFMDDGLYSVCLTVMDDDGSTNMICYDVTVVDLAPTAAFTWNPEPQDEGSPVQFTDDSTSYPDSITGWSWDFAGFGVSDLQNPEFAFNDNAIFTVTLIVTDDDDSTTSISNDITVLNVAPTITSIILPIDPLEIGTPTYLTATFLDPGLLDIHIASIDWGDGNITNGAITGSGGTYTVTDSWTYGQTGVYTITLTVEDDDGGSDITIYQYVVVYDPTDGFVTGGGWIMSPEGAYTPDPTLTGKANFGFVAKYKKGRSTPDGNTEFNFKVANMNFHSNDYEWLVIIIAGAKAIYKGTGTINGEGNYGFMLSGIDEDLTPSTDVDLFRIKIWDKDNNDEIIYDNQLGEEDDSDPTTQISGGNIKIHKG